MFITHDLGYYIVYDYHEQEKEQVKLLAAILSAQGFDYRQNRFGSDCFRGNDPAQSQFLQWLFESLFFAQKGKEEFHKTIQKSLPSNSEEDLPEAISDDLSLDDQEEFELTE